MWKKLEPVKLSKQATVLHSICKECGRKGKIPSIFCNECWKEMNKTFNTKEK